MSRTRRRFNGRLCPPNPPRLAASCSPRCSLPVANLRLRWGIPTPPISIIKCYVILSELTTKLCIIIVIGNWLINNPIYWAVSLLKKCKIGVKNESVPYYDNEAWWIRIRTKFLFKVEMTKLTKSMLTLDVRFLAFGFDFRIQWYGFYIWNIDNRKNRPNAFHRTMALKFS